MEETKISYQTARLANLKGFDPNVKLKKNSHYSDLTEQLDSLGTSGAVVVHHYYAANQALLQKWLREVHNIHLMVEPYYNEQDLLVYGFDLLTVKIDEETITEEGFKTYEEALEIALFEALNLI